MQLTVRIQPALERALRGASRRLRRRNSEIVRMALEEFLGIHSGEAAHHFERVRHLLGTLDSGIPDLAVEHRKHILESLKHGR